MSFARSDVDKLLADCHRRCCICHQYCGVKMETDHIVPQADGGQDAIDNAIAVCFECHAEIHCYNDNHPRGRKFRPEELRMHRDRWLQICRETPAVLLDASRRLDTGPLQALVDEIEYNSVVARHTDSKDRGALFRQEQFKRAIHEGMLAILDPRLKDAICEAYRAMDLANECLHAERNQDSGELGDGYKMSATDRALKEVPPKIQTAKEELMHFLGSESKELGA